MTDKMLDGKVAINRGLEEIGRAAAIAMAKAGADVYCGDIEPMMKMMSYSLNWYFPTAL